MTVRALMAGVLLVALSCKACEELDRKHQCDAMARRRVTMASRRLRAVRGRVAADGSIRFDPDWRLWATEEERAEAVRAAEYHLGVARAFERAGWRPWLPIPTDPAGPPPSD